MDNTLDLETDSINKTIDRLMILTREKNYDEIKRILNYFDIRRKGNLFEIYLTRLLKGNNFNAVKIGKVNDKGVDIILVDGDNSERIIQVIQAKNQRVPLSQDELALEINKYEKKGKKEYGNCKVYSFYSVNGYRDNCTGYDKYNVNLFGWEDIKFLIDYYDSPTSNRLITNMYPHNLETFKNLTKMWETHNKVCCVQATGTGKSFIIVQAILSNEGKKVFFAPSEKILEHIKEKGARLDPNVEYYTYAWLIRRSDEFIQNMSFDLIVLDEFHRVGSEEWGKSIRTLLTHNQQARVLGTSATPVRRDGTDMAEVLFDNKKAVNISLPEAIVRDILPVPNYIVALYEIDEVIKRMDEQIEIFDGNNRIKAKYKKEIESFRISWASASGMSQVFNKHIRNESKFIVFCKGGPHLKRMKAIVHGWFSESDLNKDIKIYQSTSEDSIQGNKNLEEFRKDNSKNTIKLLFTIDRLNEGIHIPSVDGVILLRNTDSHRIYFQQIGRAFNAGEDRMPLIFDLVNNFEMLKEINFIKDLEIAMDRLNNYRGERNLHPKKAQFKFVDETKKILDYMIEIEDRIKDQWYEMYETLLLYKEDNGNVLSFLMSGEHSNLKRWCEIQRYNYLDKKILSKKKFLLLEKIGFLFLPHQDKWHSFYTLAEEHKKNKGTIITNYPDSQMSLVLSEWLKEQLELYKNSELDEEQYRLLTTLEYDFTGEEEKWYSYLSLAKKFKEDYHHLYTDHPDQLMDEKLKIWLSSQRKYYNNQELSQEKIDYLTTLGYLFNNEEEQAALVNFIIESDWERNFQVIKDIYKEEIQAGNLKIDATFNQEDIEWLIKQREDYRNLKLSDEKINKLKSINFELNYVKLEFEVSAKEFKTSPNKQKKWATEVYRQFKLGNLPKWKLSILQEYNILDNLLYLQESEDSQNEQRNIDVGMDPVKVTFENAAKEFKQYPSKQKTWAVEVYTLFTNNTLQEWQQNILRKYNIFDHIISLSKQEKAASNNVIRGIYPDFLKSEKSIPVGDKKQQSTEKGSIIKKFSLILKKLLLFKKV
ncbi:hypothetical protein GJU40_14625 [Bacillus lacus]|uniref:DEAD/DEAH box helicase n=1 Tax=Metabacillus lacus TaxID=1983721 RepID=A0A7X2J0W2_9BACI|nr:Helicase associated domain protein [Metabacillus lacus]MRX73381.1 hypothetical protein [Metabacillus lacus]